MSSADGPVCLSRPTMPEELKRNRGSDESQGFDLKDVRLLQAVFVKIWCVTLYGWASIEVDRLLHSFRTNAGVFAGREGGYMTVEVEVDGVPWTAWLRGHTGRSFPTYSLMYRGLVVNSSNKGDSLLDGTAGILNALGNGYLSAYPEELINRNIRGTSVWAPWYTLHKLFLWIVDQYLYSDNQKALEVVVRMADWAYHKLKPLDEFTRQKMIRNEFGGVNESFYNLYAITGDEFVIGGWLNSFTAMKWLIR